MLTIRRKAYVFATAALALAAASWVSCSTADRSPGSVKHPTPATADHSTQTMSWEVDPTLQLSAFGTAIGSGANFNLDLAKRWISATPNATAPPAPLTSVVEHAKRSAKNSAELNSGWMLGELNVDSLESSSSDSSLVITCTDPAGTPYSTSISGWPAGSHQVGSDKVPESTVAGRRSGSQPLPVVTVDDPFANLPVAAQLLFGIASAYAAIPPAHQGTQNALREQLGLVIPEETRTLLKEQLGPVELLQTPDGFLVFHFRREKVDHFYRCQARPAPKGDGPLISLDYARSDVPNHPLAYILKESTQYTVVQFDLSTL